MTEENQGQQTDTQHQTFRFIPSEYVPSLSTPPFRRHKTPNEPKQSMRTDRRRLILAQPGQELGPFYGIF
jgi:hypothetical protein